MSSVCHDLPGLPSGDLEVKLKTKPCWELGDIWLTELSFLTGLTDDLKLTVLIFLVGVPDFEILLALLPILMLSGVGGARRSTGKVKEARSHTQVIQIKELL